MGDSTEPEGKRTSNTSSTVKEQSIDHCKDIVQPIAGVGIVSLDKVVIEKIVSEGDGSREVVLTKIESSKKISVAESSKKLEIGAKVQVSEKSERRGENCEKSEKPKNASKGSGPPNGISSSKAKFNPLQKSSQLPVLKAKKSGSVSSLVEKRISPVKLTKSSSITSINKETKNPKHSNLTKANKVPPKVPAKPKIKKQASPISYKPLPPSSSPITKASDPESNLNASSDKDKGKVEVNRSAHVEREPVKVPAAVEDGSRFSAPKKLEVSKVFRPRPASSVESSVSQRPTSLGELVAGKISPEEIAEATAANFAAQTHLRNSQSKIEELQRGLQTKINASTAETYKQRLPSSRSSGVKTRLVKSLDLNENITREKFDEEFLRKHSFDKQLKIEEKRVLVTDIDYDSETEKTETKSDIPKELDFKVEKRKYSRTVSEIEKRWSGEFFEGHLDQNSSESSKSSYVEELGSISSHEGIVADSNAKFIEEIRRRSEVYPAGDKKLSLKSNHGILEDSVSTVGSISCVEDRIRDIDDEVDVVVTKSEESNASQDSTLKESSSSTTTNQSSIVEDTGTTKKSVASGNANGTRNKNVESVKSLKNNNVNETVTKSVDADKNNAETKSLPKVNEVLVDKAAGRKITGNEVELRIQKVVKDSQNPDLSDFDKDGYADLIKTFTMEAETSKAPKEEKKRKGLRRLLPGLFSPKDSRKEYKKEQKERKKREEKQFGQYQQNGNYTRSPDTMNLNEDIKRNVKLNTSLNSSIIEERLNEIKQELFPEQGLTTSTPDHFLQAERSGIRPHSRNQRFYTANSSLSSIAPEDKWMDQNIISGSPDMRNLKQRKVENDPKCSLERKHSLQEPQSRFFRNHGPSGRTSAPPGERFLIRPRAVHPVDRPLPAIPQKVEFSNYENHHEIQKYPGRHPNAGTYPREPYARQALTYQQNDSQLQYTDRSNLDKSAQNRNNSIDSGFNLTPVSAQVKITRQPVINQNQKAPLLRRSPKYSPSSSQKSGDYADSSYTPNSSQKSEFSPSSSKSGEYYVNSPRTSVQTSPNDSLTDKREQIYENNRQSPKIPYPISPNVKIQNRHDPVYDITSSMNGNPSTPERARSPVTYDDPPTTPRNFKPGSLTVLPLHATRDTPEAIYVQRSPPHIPLSANLAKLSVHAENPQRTLAGSQSGSENHANRHPEIEMGSNSPVRSSDNPPRNKTVSPIRNRSPASPQPVTTPHASRTQRPVVSSTPRLTSPLTVLPLDISNFGVSRVSPNSMVVQMRNCASPLARPISPSDRTPNRVIDQLKTPTTSPRMNESRQKTPVSGPYVPMASRRSQPSEQILIASPKRDAYYEPQVHRPTNARMTEHSASPVPMTDSPNIIVQAPVSPGPSDESMYETSGVQATTPRPMPNESSGRKQIRAGNQSVNIQKPEPIYGHRTVSPSRTQEYGYEQRPLSPMRAPEVYGNGTNRGSALSSPNTSGAQVPASPSPNTRQDAPVQRPTPRTERPNLSESQQSIYSTRQTSNPEPVYSQGVSRQPSPSKRQTMQHLEAFYWQQKALESQRKLNSSPSTTPQQNEPRIDHPEIQEAMYWQQLKKLDEEQQRRIYQQNIPDERNDPLYWRRKLQSPPTSPSKVQSSRRSTSPNVPNQSCQTSGETAENVYWRSKLQQPKTTANTKPPIMGQKGQNQPVLVVRPQPVYQEKEFENREILAGQRVSKREPPPRSKSASPLFARGEERRSLSLPRKIDTDDGGFLRATRERSSIAALRKTETPPIYEEDVDHGDKKPPPIFKRGSLISNSSNSVDYGTGQKRVSFSNQTTKADVGAGIWPTKHGMAPEPPTRQHRVDRASTTSESDSVFLHDVENQNNSNTNVYGNVLARSVSQTDSATSHCGNQPPFGTHSIEYAANRPLPPPPREPMRFLRRSNSARDQPKPNYVSDDRGKSGNNPRRWPAVSESESGSEAGEIQRILRRRSEEEWNPDGKGRQSNDTGGSGRGEGEGGNGDLPGGGGRRVGVAGVGGGVARGTGGGGGRSRDEPRRHTLSGDHQPSLHHQQFNAQLHPLHPHHLPPHGRYGTPSSRHATTMDLESPLPRGYPPPSTAMLFDDDPGIMSEVETSSTGFRRGGKQRSSLPVVRTPSKTLERPLGLVFLQYRNETKRALLPNEITSIDTVKALFVRSFPKQLTMEYLDSPLVKVYIHDSNKDMFYELEDMRSHLRDIRDRSVLRLFESSDGVAGMPGPLGAPGGGGGLPPHWEDQSYFSEPEFDSEYQHQHIHKSKTAKNSTSGNGGYYMGGSSTLPRGGPLLRAYSPAGSSAVSGPNATSTQSKSLGTPDRLHGESGYMSSPERGGGVGAGSGRYPTGPYSTGSSYEDPYYSQYSGTVTPVIDEEARIRVEHMERQLANLTGLVQKALTHAPHASPSPRDYLQVPAPRDPYRTAERERHKPAPPPKPATLAAGQYVYRDLTLTPEMYNQLRGIQKKAKDLRQEVLNLRRMSQAQAHTVRETIRDTFITIRAVLLSGGDAAWAAGDTEKVRLNREEDLYKQQMIRLEKDLTELESTVEELRGNVINRKTRVNMSDVENMALILNKSSKTVADLKVRFPSLQEGMKGLLSSEMEKVVREEKFLKEEPERLESALRRCKKLTGTLVTLKRLASVQEQRLPNAASVEAEETPPITPTSGQHSKTTAPAPAERTVVGSTGVVGGGSHALNSSASYQQRPENALDALLDELQTFSRPASQLSQTSSIGYAQNITEIGRSASQISQMSHAPSMSDIGRKGSIDSSTNLAISTTPGHTSTLRRLHSYPSSSDTDTSPPIARLQVSDSSSAPPQKPPVPERNAELLQLATARRVPPPPPPRTSSRSPLASPTSPQLPPRNPTGTLRRGRSALKESGKPPMALPPNANQPEDGQQPQQGQQIPPNNILSASNSSSCESINSQEGLQNKKGRQEQLEQRHQELLRKQKALQEQYARLQQLQRNASGLTTVPPAPPDLLKKTGSESNLLAKMGLGLSTASSGSLTSLASRPELSTTPTPNASGNQTTTNKIYETDIL